jgi:hypothetical protein
VLKYPPTIPLQFLLEISLSSNPKICNVLRIHWEQKCLGSLPLFMICLSISSIMPYFEKQTHNAPPNWSICNKKGYKYFHILSLAHWDSSFSQERTI